MKDARALQREPGREGARRGLGMRIATPLGTPRAQQRRTQPPGGGRWRGARALVALGLVAGASAAAVIGVGELLSSAEALPMRTLAVRGVEGVAADEVRAYASVDPGTPLFSVPLDDVAGRVLEHPYVRTAEVRRVPPDTIEVRVEMRTPVALLAVGGLYLVDELGGVFKSARAGDGLDLPLVTGLKEEDIHNGAAANDLQQALALLRAHAKAGAPGGEVSEVTVAGDGALSLVLGSGARVFIGDDQRGGTFEQKLTRLAVIVDRLAAAGQQAATIRLDDERRPERAAVRLRAAPETAPRGG